MCQRTGCCGGLVLWARTLRHGEGGDTAPREGLEGLTGELWQEPERNSEDLCNEYCRNRSSTGIWKIGLISLAFQGAACLNLRLYAGFWTVYLWYRWNKFACTLDWVCHSWRNDLVFLRNKSVSFREVSIHILYVLAGPPLLQAAWQQTARKLFFFPMYSSSQAFSGRSGCPRAGSRS